MSNIGSPDLAAQGLAAEEAGTPLTADPNAPVPATTQSQVIPPVQSAPNPAQFAGQFSPDDLTRRTTNLARLYPTIAKDPTTLQALATQPVSDDELYANVAGATTAGSASRQAGILTAMADNTARWTRWQGYTGAQQQAIINTGFKPPANPQHASSFWGNVVKQLSSQPERLKADLSHLSFGTLGDAAKVATGADTALTAFGAATHAAGEAVTGAAHVADDFLAHNQVGKALNSTFSGVVGPIERTAGPKADLRYLSDVAGAPKHLYRAAYFDPSDGSRLGQHSSPFDAVIGAGIAAVPNLAKLVANGQFPDAWERTDNHAPYYTPKAVDTATKAVGGDPGGLALAKAIASSGGDISKGVAKYVGPANGPNDAAHAQAFSAAYSAAQTPEMAAGVRALALGGVSYGRDAARGMGLSEGTQQFNLVSGAADAAYTFYTDPTIAAGKALEATRLARAVAPGAVNEAIDAARTTPEMDAALAQRTVTSYSQDPIAYMHQLNAVDLGSGPVADSRRGLVLMADHMAAGDAVGLQAAKPAFARAIPAMQEWNQAQTAMEGGHAIAGPNDVADFYSMGAGNIAIRNGTYGMHVSPNDVELPYLTKTGNALNALKAKATSLLDIAGQVQLPDGLQPGDLSPAQEFMVGQPDVYGTLPNRVRASLQSAVKLVPKKPFLPLIGPDAIGQFSDYIDQWKLPTLYRDQAVNAFAAAGTSAAKRDVVLQVAHAGMRANGLDATEAGQMVMEGWLQRMQTTYDTAGRDIIDVGGFQRHASLAPGLDAAQAMIIPSGDEIRQLTGSSALLKTIEGALSNDKLEALMHKAWAPAALFRLGFVPRIISEELLTTAMRLHPSELTDAFKAEGAEAVAVRSHAAEAMAGGIVGSFTGVPKDDLARYMAAKGAGLSDLVELRNTEPGNDYRAAATMIKRGAVTGRKLQAAAWADLQALAERAAQIRTEQGATSQAYQTASELHDYFKDNVVQHIYNLMSRDPVYQRTLTSSVMSSRGGYGMGAETDWNKLDSNLQPIATVKAAHDYQTMKVADDAGRSATAWNYRRHGSTPLYQATMRASEGYIGDARQVASLRGAFADTRWATAVSLDHPQISDLGSARFESEFDKYRMITSAAEKQSDPATWSAEQKAMYAAGDWKGFSHSRGYTEQEISDFGRWLELAGDGKGFDYSSESPDALFAQHVAWDKAHPPTGASAPIPDSTLVQRLRQAVSGAGPDFATGLLRHINLDQRAALGDNVGDALLRSRGTLLDGAEADTRALVESLIDDTGHLRVTPSAVHSLLVSPNAPILTSKAAVTEAARTAAAEHLADPAHAGVLKDMDHLHAGVWNPVEANRDRIYYPIVTGEAPAGLPDVSQITDPQVQKDVSRQILMHRDSSAVIARAGQAATGEGITPLGAIGYMNDPERARQVAQAWAGDGGGVGYIDLHPAMIQAQDLANPTALNTYGQLGPLESEAAAVRAHTAAHAAMVRRLAPSLGAEGVYLRDYQLAAGRALEDSYTVAHGVAGNGISYEQALSDFADKAAAHHVDLMMPRDEYLHDVSSKLLNQDPAHVTFSPSDLAARSDAELPPVTYGPQELQLGKDHLWERIVRLGFEKVVGPSLDAMARQPLYIRNLAKGIRAALPLDELLADHDLRSVVQPLLEQSPAADKWELLNAVEEHQKLIGADGVMPGYAASNTPLEDWLTHMQAQPHGLPAGGGVPVGAKTNWDLLNQWGKMENNVGETIRDTAVQRAVNDTVPFINDHSVRSQMAEVGRNLSPFYWAQENMLRRWGRTLKYSPGAIEKMDLGVHGIKSMGLIKTNQYGEDTVAFPGTQALVSLLSSKGGDRFSMPASMPMTGVVKQLVPGFANPTAPSAGPLIQFPINLLANHYPEASAADQALGGTGQTRSIVDSVVPSGWARNVYHAVIDGPDKNTQMVSARLEAMQMLAAGGQAPSDNATPAELDAWNSQVRNWSRNVMLLRAGTSFFTPGSPTVDIGNTPVAGVANPLGGVDGNAHFLTGNQINAELNTLIKNEGLNQGVADFVKAHPNATPWTVFKSTSAGPGTAPATAGALAMLSTNPAFFKDHATASAFFLPAAPDTYNKQAYLDEVKDGIRSTKDFPTVVTEIANQRAALDYWPMHDRYVAALKADGTDNAAMGVTRQKWATWEHDFLVAHPLFKAQLTDGQGAQKRTAAIADMRQALADPNVPTGPQVAQLHSLMTLYDQYTGARASLGAARDANTALQRKQIDERAAVIFTQFRQANPLAQGFFDAAIRPTLNSLDRSFVTSLGGQ